MELAPSIEQIRFVHADQHGIARGKTVNRRDFEQVVTRGLPLTSTLLLKDTSHKTVFPAFAPHRDASMADFRCGADFLVMPDPSTATILPWQPNTLWVIGDGVSKTGSPLAICSRQLLKTHIARLGAAGYSLLIGIELEFHIFKKTQGALEPSLPGRPGQSAHVQPLSRGAQYLTENRYDEMEPILESIRQVLNQLGLPPKSIEIEFGASQVEISFYPLPALQAADSVMLIRNAIKQVCARQGLHATFMCKPAFPATMASGWHLHQSLCDPLTNANLFSPDGPGMALSLLGQHYAAGLLQHAEAAMLLCCPTINSYKRFQPNVLAPCQICWGVENRGAMLRVITTADGMGNHLENRIGDPTANPYLYLSSQIVAGLLGITGSAVLPPPTVDPYGGADDRVPASLWAAMDALRRDEAFYQAFGAEFLAYLCCIKEAEIARFCSEVTDWEQREYFEVF